MGKMNLGETFVNNESEREIEIVEMEFSSHDNSKIYYKYIDNGMYGWMEFSRFAKTFTEKSKVIKKNNLNKDIIKLIDSGYEFKSFSATTVNGRYVSVDLEA